MHFFFSVKNVFSCLKKKKKNCVDDAWNEYEIKLVGSQKNVKKDQSEIWITLKVFWILSIKSARNTKKTLNNGVMELLNRRVTAIHE